MNVPIGTVGYNGFMPDSREQQLDRIIEHVAGHGMSDTSLRDLATATDTSHRMLNYHFGGRAGLVAAIVERTENAQRDQLRSIADSATSPTDIVTTQWETLTDPKLAPLIRMFFELFALAIHDRPGTEGFLDAMTAPWLDVASEVAERVGIDADRDELRLGVAVSRGLLMEVLASGDPEPATRSLHRFLDMWEASRGA